MWVRQLDSTAGSWNIYILYFFNLLRATNKWSCEHFFCFLFLFIYSPFNVLDRVCMRVGMFVLSVWIVWSCVVILTHVIFAAIFVQDIWAVCVCLQLLVIYWCGHIATLQMTIIECKRGVIDVVFGMKIVENQIRTFDDVRQRRCANKFSNHSTAIPAMLGWFVALANAQTHAHSTEHTQAIRRKYTGLFNRFLSLCEPIYSTVHNLFSLTRSVAVYITQSVLLNSNELPTTTTTTAAALLSECMRSPLRSFFSYGLCCRWVSISRAQPFTGPRVWCVRVFALEYVSVSVFWIQPRIRHMPHTPIDFMFYPKKKFFPILWCIWFVSVFFFIKIIDRFPIRRHNTNVSTFFCGLFCFQMTKCSSTERTHARWKLLWIGVYCSTGNEVESLQLQIWKKIIFYSLFRWKFPFE